MKNLIRYKPYKTNTNDGKIAERQVKTTELPINSQGENGTVFVGYIEATKKCVAVKVINELDEYENALNVSEKIQEMLPRKNRTHIIEMIDAGRRLGVSDGIRQGIFVLELGTLSFAEMVYGASLTYQNDDELGRMARRIAIPMSEFHQGT
ncbi:hypothetical protein niasHT_022027 [Heterodera trifolii]|uniref:Uncharacterized protein n=1 Tax=Heterodera trifolii TaxID=157864 RepID=A0ABD2JBV8_9BILA